MREILFRGKSEYGNKWIFGSLHSEYGETDKDGNRGIDYRILGMRGECTYIIPKTVGQFTGLTDKNGKKIFEGDIIKHYNDNQNPERFEVGMVWWDDSHLCFKRTSNPESVYVWRNCIYEVIGNIHDNPELLEVEYS
jgi:uncharacterized phage protein (TIGR01671 family)